MTVDEEGFPKLTLELVEIAGRLRERPTPEDVRRAYEIMYGAEPDPSRPVEEIAQEIVAAYTLLVPDAPNRRSDRRRRSTFEARASDGKAMTVLEIRALLEGLPVDATPKVRIAFGGTVKSMKVET